MECKDAYNRLLEERQGRSGGTGASSRPGAGGWGSRGSGGAGAAGGAGSYGSGGYGSYGAGGARRGAQPPEESYGFGERRAQPVCGSRLGAGHVAVGACRVLAPHPPPRRTPPLVARRPGRHCVWAGPERAQAV